MNHETVCEALALFVKHAETRLCRDVEMDTEGGVTRYSAMFVPYNKAKVDRVYVWVTEDRISIQVAGQTPSEEGAEHGFTHASARAETNAEFDAEALCNFMLALARGMR